MNGMLSIADLADRVRLPWRFLARAVTAGLSAEALPPEPTDSPPRSSAR